MYAGNPGVQHIMVIFVGLCIRVEKYRPGCLDDLISHKDITSTSK